ncbi:hypothetical protein [Streptomonospora salina]|uniref:Uncharacterized protein n=1 Tax=Streptomonospora salina TaxID=104205 RepID=A0A841ECT8_9ACTN|nr:hypothetical protein [Streptomonospora salina]MBB6000214.1 hypothetical protein [Streptomonospora salina]
MPWIDGDAIAKNLASTDAETGITVKGVEFAMPAKLPLAFPAYLQQEEIIKALKCLFGDRWEELLELAGVDISIDWLRDAVEAVYGGEAGKTSASSRASSTTRKSSARSKRTSGASTTRS